MSIILILPGAKVLLDCSTVLRCVIKALAVSYRRDICSRLLQPAILRGEQEVSLHRSVCTKTSQNHIWKVYRERGGSGDDEESRARIYSTFLLVQSLHVLVVCSPCYFYSVMTSHIVILQYQLSYGIPQAVQWRKTSARGFQKTGMRPDPATTALNRC